MRQGHLLLLIIIVGHLPDLPEPAARADLGGRGAGRGATAAGAIRGPLRLPVVVLRQSAFGRTASLATTPGLCGDAEGMVSGGSWLHGPEHSLLTGVLGRNECRSLRPSFCCQYAGLEACI